MTRPRLFKKKFTKPVYYWFGDLLLLVFSLLQAAVWRLIKGDYCSEFCTDSLLT